MTVRDALLLATDAFGGKIEGKTNLQKKMYFLGIMLREDFGYGPHYYGPYSARVASATQELKALGFLTESKSSAGIADKSGFEVARHDFSLSGDGRLVLAIKKVQCSEDWDRVRTAADRLSRAGDLNYMELSIAAKSYFILQQQGKTIAAEELVRLAKGFDWSITEKQVEKAAEFLQDLELATMAA